MRWIIFIVAILIIDIYAFQAFRTLIKSKNLWVVYAIISLVVLGNLVFQLINTNREQGYTTPFYYAIGFFLAFYVAKIVLVLVLGLEDIFRFVYGIAVNISENKLFTKQHIPSRRSFVSTIALGLAAIPFGSLLYGMYKGKYNYKVLKYSLEFDDLPDAFDGYTITQISDVHSGSFDNPEKIQYGIDLINEQKSDVLFFTGDFVNNIADELDPWKEMFSKLEAPDGKFSILGNHDYGDYVSWDSETEKENNLNKLKQYQKDMGFDLLLNEHRYLEKDGQKIALLGVENWGSGHFIKVGDLDKTVANIDKNDFKILLSHDPTHWEQKVLSHPYHYHITLSGHTHGMQFGIEIPGWIKWSPSKWRYKHWAGMYSEKGEYLNVNRGFGYLGYPGRVGIWPEITVIELKKKPVS